MQSSSEIGINWDWEIDAMRRGKVERGFTIILSRRRDNSLCVDMSHIYIYTINLLLWQLVLLLHYDS